MQLGDLCNQNHEHITLALFGVGYIRLHVDVVKLEWWYDELEILKATWEGGFLRFQVEDVEAVTKSNSGWTITINLPRLFSERGWRKNL